MSLTATVYPDHDNGVIVVTLRGLLAMESAPTARAALLKSIAQSPEAVIVDLSQMETASRTLLTIFPAAARTHGPPVVTLLLCGASARLASQMTGRVLGDVPVYDTMELAMASLAQPRTACRAHLHLAPVPAAAARARHLVDEACRFWGVGHLSGAATLVISELVSNAVQHARTDMHISAALRGNYLHLYVRDGDAHPPVMSTIDIYDEVTLPEHGRGLHLVDVYTTSWGSRPTEDGKIVWATLRATPVPRARTGSR